MQPQSWTIAVAGMTCGGCKRKIEGGLAPLSGVHGLEVDLAAGEVRFRAEPADRDAALASIEALGFGVTRPEASAPRDHAETTFNLAVTGLAASGSVPAIQRALREVPGIAGASVDREASLVSVRAPAERREAAIARLAELGFEVVVVARWPLPVIGMRGPACADRIRLALLELAGVVSAEADLERGVLTVEAPDELRPAVVSRIEALGYGVAVGVLPSKAAAPGAGRSAPWELPISGMTCAACATRIATALEGLEGIEAARVNFAASRALLTGDPARRPQAIRRIEDLGYGVPIDGQEDASSILPLAGAALGTLGVMALMRWPHPVAASLQAILATAVVVLAGARFHRKAMADLRRGAFAMDALVSLGTLTACAWSVSLLAGGATEPGWFDAAGMITTLVLAGRWLEERARRRARAALGEGYRLDAEDIELEDGRLLRPAELEEGDRCRVRPGQHLPADGRVVAGTAAIDEALLTGEPLPRGVGPGDELSGGTLVLEGSPTVSIVRRAEDSAAARVQRLVTEAQGRRAGIERLVDRITQRFVPAISALAAATALGWLAAGESPSEAVRRAVSVLLVACPCALGLATPMAFLVASAVAVRRGVLMKGADIIERARRIDVLCLDKTGTLTVGAPRLVSVAVADPAFEEEEVVRLAAALEEHSSHPIARSLRRAAAERGRERGPAEELVERPGFGVEGLVEGRRHALGRQEFFSDRPSVLAAAEALTGTLPAAATPVLLAREGRLLAVLGFEDEVHEAAQAAVSAARGMGMELVLLSGDTPAAVAAVAERLGLREAFGGLSPEEKREHVRRLRDSGRRVAFAGDGLNDAPALAEADLGLALHQGLHQVRDAAGMIVLRPGPAGIPTGLRLARRTLAAIRQNLFWAFAYNVAVLPLAMSGALRPVHAALAMSLSSLFVVGNSLRLWRFR